MTHAYLGEELRIGLPGAGFEVAAKRIGHQARHRGDLIQVDLL